MEWFTVRLETIEALHQPGPAQLRIVAVESGWLIVISRQPPRPRRRRCTRTRRSRALTSTGAAARASTALLAPSARCCQARRALGTRAGARADTCRSPSSRPRPSRPDCRPCSASLQYGYSSNTTTSLGCSASSSASSSCEHSPPLAPIATTGLISFTSRALRVPIYSITSLISLYSLDLAFFLDAFRDVYEVSPARFRLPPTHADPSLRTNRLSLSSKLYRLRRGCREADRRGTRQLPNEQLLLQSPRRVPVRLPSGNRRL